LGVSAILAPSTKCHDLQQRSYQLDAVRFVSAEAIIYDREAPPNY